MTNLIGGIIIIFGAFFIVTLIASVLLIFGVMDNIEEWFKEKWHGRHME